MKKNLLPMLLFILLLSACSPETTVPSTAIPVTAGTDLPVAPIVITDALGRTVTLEGTPQRVVVTGKGLFMIADAIYIFPEASERIAGIGDAGQGSSNFISMIDPDYAAKVILDRDAGAEQVAALQPDLVILKSYLAESTGQPIEVLGIPVVYIDFETPEQYPRDLAILGKIFQNETRAAEIAAYYQAQLDGIRQATAEADTLPRVLMLYYSDKDGIVAFNVPPMTWMQTRLVELAGGEPVWQDANPGGGWTQVTLEQIAAWDADMIFVIAYNTDPAQVVAGMKTDPNWQAIRAVQQEQLFAFPGDFYSWDQPDPRWVLGLTWLAGRLHPELFPDLDITAEAQFFYQTLYGLDAGFFNENIFPTFKGDLP